MPDCAGRYLSDPERTAQTRSADGTMATVGDVGYVDDDGFLYLTDRSTFMISVAKTAGLRAAGCAPAR